MDTQYFRCKKIYLFFYLFILTMLGLSACGRQKGTADSTFWAESDQVAVADFQQMKLPITLEALEQYATDGKWFYISREKFGPESTTGQVLRSRIQDNLSPKKMLSVWHWQWIEKVTVSCCGKRKIISLLKNMANPAKGYGM